MSESLPKFEDLNPEEQARAIQWKEAWESEQRRRLLESAPDPLIDYVPGADRGSKSGHNTYFGDDSDIGPPLNLLGEHKPGEEYPLTDLPGTAPDADLPFGEMSDEDKALCESDIALALRIFRTEGEVFPVVFKVRGSGDWDPHIFLMPPAAELPALVRLIHENSRRPDVVGTYFNPNQVRRETQNEFRKFIVTNSKSMTRCSRGVRRTDFDTIRYANWDFDAHADTTDADNKDSSTVAEHAATREGIKRLRDYLKIFGLPYPEVISSGNGHQAFSALDPIPTDSRRVLRQFQLRVLNDLAKDFKELGITFDPKVFRVESWVRFPGTPNRKGPGTKKRPHAVARFKFLESPYLFRESTRFADHKLLMDCRQISFEELQTLAGKTESAGATKQVTDYRLLEADPERFVKEYLSNDDADAEEQRDFEDDDAEPARCWEFRCRWNKHADGGRKAFLIQRHDGKIRVGCHAAKCNVDAKGKPSLRTMEHLLEAVEPRWRSIPWLKLLTNPPPALEFGRLASEVVPKFTRWLMPQWIPLGMMTILEGETAVGKSTLVSELIYHISRGVPWPDGTPCEKGFTILCVSEESVDQRTIPRLMAAGADLDKVLILESEFKLGDQTKLFSLPRDGAILERLIAKHNAVFVVLDTLFDYLHFEKDAKDSFIASAVREKLLPLKRIVDRQNCAIMPVRHWTKDTNASLVYRGGGSEAFGSFVRSVVALRWWDEKDDSHKDPRRTVFCVKPAGKRPDPKAFTLGGANVEIENQNVSIGKLEWLPPDTVLPTYERKSGPNPDKLDAAKEFLYTKLSVDEPTLVAEIEAMAASEGISRHALHEAKRAIRAVESRKLPREEALPLGYSGAVWTWRLII